MVFRSLAITGKWPAKLNESGDVDSRTGLIGSAQDLRSPADLKACAVDQSGAQNGGESSREALIAREAAPSAAGIDQAIHVECIANLAIVGERVLRQK